MKPGSRGNGHGKEKEIPTGSISETVLHRGAVPGIFSGYAVERGGTCAQNVDAATLTGYRMDGISAPNAAIRFL